MKAFCDLILSLSFIPVQSILHTEAGRPFQTSHLVNGSRTRKSIHDLQDKSQAPRHDHSVLCALACIFILGSGYFFPVRNICAVTSLLTVNSRAPAAYTALSLLLNLLQGSFNSGIT